MLSSSAHNPAILSHRGVAVNDRLNCNRSVKADDGILNTRASNDEAAARLDEGSEPIGRKFN